MARNFRTLICSLALFTALFSSRTFAQSNDDRIGADLPDFSFPEISGTALTNLELKEWAPVIVFYFDPGCEHCQEQATMLNEQIEKFSGTNLLFVAFAEPADVKTYRDTYFPGGQKKNMFFCTDPTYKFDKTFGYSQAPTIHIYNKSWKKVKVFRNEIAVEEILKLIQ